MLPKAPSQANIASATSASSTAGEPEPMHLGLLCTSLTPEERQGRRQNNLCLYCGEEAHYVRNCPAKARKCLTTLPVTLPLMPSSFTHDALPISFHLLAFASFDLTIWSQGTVISGRHFTPSVSSHFGYTLATGT